MVYIEHLINNEVFLKKKLINLTIIFFIHPLFYILILFLFFQFHFYTFFSNMNSNYFWTSLTSRKLSYCLIINSDWTKSQVEINIFFC